MKNFQFITHCNSRYDYVSGARMALEGGCRWIQLRMKGASDAQVCAAAEVIMPLCRHYGATFILDDRVDFALRLHADGVHLGRNDMPVAEARAMLGSEFIIGGTANTIDDIVRLNNEGADYIGCGPFRFTTTKQNLSPVLGLEGYRAIVAGMKERGITLPLIAIGGITPDDIPSLFATGVSGIAVSGAILDADDPVEQTKLINEVDSHNPA